MSGVAPGLVSGFMCSRTRLLRNSNNTNACCTSPTHIAIATDPHKEREKPNSIRCNVANVIYMFVMHARALNTRTHGHAHWTSVLVEDRIAKGLAQLYRT